MTVAVEWRFEIESSPGTERVTFICTLPQTITNRQRVRRLTFNPQPTMRFSEGGNEYARYDLSCPPRRSKINIAAELELARCDMETLSARPAETDWGDSGALSDYLSAERMIESDAPAVRQIAAAVPEGPAIATVKAIFETTLAHLQKSEYMTDDRGAAGALAAGRGDCSEFSDLFVALCRARGIPAFVNEGFIITPVKPGDTPKHAWAEAYLAGLGWVPFDPFHAAWQSARFEAMSPTRIILSRRRNDPVLQNYHHWFYQYWGDPIRVHDAFIVRSARPTAASVSRPAVAR